ncbi:MAG TPA: succinyl-diaminopimelate desuccinylase, partial [Mycobacteriales bacterium]|nr:succinyl-diaminopimelate desuccinylase [Mycobacteriales bacterium]
MALDLTLPGAALTATLVDVPSVSGSEGRIADLVDDALRELSHLEVIRDGDAVVARTRLDRERRIV